jgi:hypothetical protein
MTLLQAVDKAVAETGVERYRYLCLEHPDPAMRESFARWILAGMPSHKPASSPPAMNPKVVRAVDAAVAGPAPLSVSYDPVVPASGCGGCGSR